MFIDRVVDSLPQKLKDVVILYYLEGFKIAEIAERLAIGESLVKYRLTNARKQLERFGKEDGYEKEKERI